MLAYGYFALQVEATFSEPHWYVCVIDPPNKICLSCAWGINVSAMLPISASVYLMLKQSPTPFFSFYIFVFFLYVMILFGNPLKSPFLSVKMLPPAFLLQCSVPVGLSNSHTPDYSHTPFTATPLYVLAQTCFAEREKNVSNQREGMSDQNFYWVHCDFWTAQSYVDTQTQEKQATGFLFSKSHWRHHWLRFSNTPQNGG